MHYNCGNTEGVFRSGFMESGTALPSGHVDRDCLQSKYDGVVTDSGRPQTATPCLRQVPTSVLKAATDKTPSFLSYQVRLTFQLS